MMRSELRFAILGCALGLMVAVTPSCAKKCDATNCQGCCTSSAECVTAVSATSCGTGASSCVACTGDEVCNAGVCADPGTLSDGGMVVDAGHPPCRTDDECADLKNGSVCDTRTGECVIGRPCNGNTDCQPNDPSDPCYRLGVQCRCDLRDAPDAGGASFNGTCRRRRASCESCLIDADCGDDPFLYSPPDGIGYGKCRALQGDTSGAKFCFYQRVGQCPCGTVQDNEGLCRPQGNSCSEVGCRNDKNCASGSVCTVNLPEDGGAVCGGICKARCRWDFEAKANVAPGCPVGETCWVDSANLDPTSIYYGSGRCKPPCNDNGDCQASPANPFGGANLKCAAETLKGGSLDGKRCRANGACMDNSECPELPNNQPNLGYCDRGSFTCKQDCRTGNDPVSGQAYRDCRPPYACAADGGARVCKLLTCVEQGGAAIACRRGQYCCGEDKNRDGTADPCPPLAERDPAGCYDLPKPPFCTACMGDADCANARQPAWLSCPNGSKSPSCSTLPMRCVYAGDKMSAGDGINICAPSTYNDDTMLPNGRRISQLGCPSGYSVQYLRPDFTPMDNDSTCASNADCNVGTDAGSCEPDPGLRLQDGGLGKSCRCTIGAPGTERSQCPNSTDGGIRSECRWGAPGQKTFCIDTVACFPGGRQVYEPTAEPTYGCGL